MSASAGVLRGSFVSANRVAILLQETALVSAEDHLSAKAGRLLVDTATEFASNGIKLGIGALPLPATPGGLPR